MQIQSPKSNENCSSDANRSVAGSLALIVNSGIESVAAFFFSILVARSLGVTGFGLLNFALAWSAIITTVGDVGLTLYVGKSVASAGKEWSGSFASIFRLKRRLLYFILPPLVVVSLVHPVIRSNLPILAVILVGETIRSLSVFICFVFRGLRHAYLEPFVLGSERILILLVGAVVLWLGGGIWGVAAILVGVRLLAFILALRLLGGLQSKDHSISPTRLSSADIFTSLRLGIYLICDRMIIQGTTVILMFFGTEWETGIFQAAYKIVMVPAILSAAFAGSLIGPLTVAQRKGIRDFRQLFLLGLRLNSHLMLGMGITLLLWAPRLVNSIYGPDYGSAATVLRILILHSTAFGLYHIAVFTFQALNEERYLAYAMVSGVAITVVLTPLAVSWGGANGASWVLGTTSWILCAFLYLRLKSLDILTTWKWLVIPGLFTLAAVLLPERLLPSFSTLTNISIPVLLAITGMLYLAGVYLLGTTREDKQHLRNIASSILNWRFLHPQ